MREKHWKTSGFRDSQREFSKAIFITASFWSLVLRWEASTMAVLIFFMWTYELSFWMANLMGAEDTEGFFFHKKYECCPMIAVAKQ
jgi:hypothetical protein